MVYPALPPLMAHTSAASSRLNWRSPADLNGLANAVCSQYPSYYLGTWCIQHYYRWCRTPRLPVVDWTEAPGQFKWTSPFRRKTKSGFCACAITFQLTSTASIVLFLSYCTAPVNCVPLEQETGVMSYCVSSVCTLQMASYFIALMWASNIDSVFRRIRFHSITVSDVMP